MVHLTIEMPEEALSALRETPERFTTELRFAAAVQWYHQGRISGSKAAQIAGMTRLEFLDELARRKLDVVKVDLDRLREEIGACLSHPSCGSGRRSFPRSRSNARRRTNT